MTYEVLLRPEAEADIHESYQWYESQIEGLGEEFLRIVDASLSLIQRNPFASIPSPKSENMDFGKLLQKFVPLQAEIKA